MKTLTWIGGILALSLCACGGPKGYVIQGELTGIPDSTTLYLIDANNLQIMDSALMIGGHFRMENQLTEEPGDLRLRAILQPNGTQINLRLLIGNESIRIKGDISDFPYHVKVSGSKYQKQWDDFAQATLKYDLQADSLIKAFRNLPAETRDQNRFGEQLHSIYQITDSIKQDYILHHPNSFPGLIHLQYNMWKFPKDTLQMLFEQMPPSLKSHSFAKPIQTFITCEKVEEGDRFLDFEAEDQNGHRVRLSDWAGKKEKYILLDFTHYWCRPCRVAIKEMHEMIDTYSDSLQIISISMDNKRDDWSASVKQDSVDWPSLWSNEQLESKIVSIPYQVWSYPTFIIIDPQGKVIQRWVGYSSGMFEEKIGWLKNK